MTTREILRRTSRSFYLTLRVLPRGVREEVSQAYLLARATDTLADNSGQSVSRRLGVLRAARECLGEPTIAGFDAGAWSGGPSEAAERELIRALPELWREMSTAAPGVRALRQKVLSHILEGQIFDLERFGGGSPPLNEAEVERYTYLVAGSVGEFWTDLCARRLGEFSAGNLAEMRQVACHYGQGLQLVNMLRDRVADARMGRVYIRPGSEAFHYAKARQYLRGAEEYVAALRQGRLRLAVILPAMIGWRTLDLLDETSSEGSGGLQKISRSDVRKVVLRAAPVLVSRRGVSLESKTRP